MNKTKLHEMMQLQDKFNATVDPIWREDEHRCDNTAMLVEAGELIDHLGFKWWKHQVPNIKQAQMELVDIWHFLMSDLIRSFPEEAIAALDDDSVLFDGVLDVIKGGMINEAEMTEAERTRAAIKTATVFIAATACDMNELSSTPSDEESPQFESVFPSHVLKVQMFSSLMLELQVTESMLYKWYIGKNALNNFRQANGYKTGEYIKHWNNQEDNEVLVDIIELAGDRAGLFDHVLSELDKSYQMYAKKVA